MPSKLRVEMHLAIDENSSAVQRCLPLLFINIYGMGHNSGGRAAREGGREGSEGLVNATKLLRVVCHRASLLLLFRGLISEFATFHSPPFPLEHKEVEWRLRTKRPGDQCKKKSSLKMLF